MAYIQVLQIKFQYNHKEKKNPYVVIILIIENKHPYLKVMGIINIKMCPESDCVWCHLSFMKKSRANFPWKKIRYIWDLATMELRSITLQPFSNVGVKIFWNFLKN